LLFFQFFSVFLGDLGFFYSHPHPDSTSFLLVGHIQLPMAPFS